MNLNKNYHVIVIGGGHAGVEASAASARLGATTALITMKLDNLGEMSCNPSIGGIGKGTIVREIDALDGIMGRAADAAMINFKMLNSSKGPAIWGPRAQSDRKLYKQFVRKQICNTNCLNVIEDKVMDIKKEKDTFVIYLDSGLLLTTNSLVITTGTFLHGLIHIGEQKTKGGRAGEQRSTITDSLREFGIEFGRLKTGTPARILKSSIDFSNLEAHSSDKNIIPFSYLTKDITIPQIDCYLTHTNTQTHEIIIENSKKSPIYNGDIKTRGPRYCPSIEDKIIRFVAHDRHRVFLEPEGLDNDLIYPNGISTAMPLDVQEKFIRTIKGLENCEIVKPGYAIEYDFHDPVGLYKTLEVKKVPGLFFAGQINGTTGYEEAAGQGVVAGVNAAIKALCFKKDFILDRTNSYIGVMIDDITTNGVLGEPYRMFTSRAEYRLKLRSDNADRRLTEIGRKFGIVSDQRYNIFTHKMKQINDLMHHLESTQFTPYQLLKEHNIEINQDGKRRSLFDLLSLDKFDSIIERIFPEIIKYDQGIVNDVKYDALYHQYVIAQEKEINALSKADNIKIPNSINYKNIGGLSNEVIEKLSNFKPNTLGEARKIPGITPSSIIIIMIYLNKND